MVESVASAVQIGRQLGGMQRCREEGRRGKKGREEELRRNGSGENCMLAAIEKLLL